MGVGALWIASIRTGTRTQSVVSEYAGKRRSRCTGGWMIGRLTDGGAQWNIDENTK